MALSFQEIQDLVEEALAAAYPPVPQGDDMPMEYSHRFHIRECWSDRAFLCKGYYSADSDPKYASVSFSIKEGPGDDDGDDDDVSVELGPLVPMKMQAVSDDGSIVLELESDQSVSFNIDEAGRRNSKADAQALNSAIRAIAGLLNNEDLDGETIDSINKIILQPIATPSESAPMESSESWDGSKSRFTVGQLLRSVPRAMARWARKNAKEKNRAVTKGDLHLPYKEPDGKINPDGVRNALSRLSQVKGVPDEVRRAAQTELRRALARANAAKGESESRSEAWHGPDGETVTETMVGVVEGTFDKNEMVVRDHVVLGPVSKNGYRYPVKVQQESIGIFEGAKAYLNHPVARDMGEARDVRDLIGEHRNLRVVGEKTYSDLYLVNNRTVQDHVLPIVESAPHLIGSSVVIRGKLKKVEGDMPEMEKIFACRSIDLVSEPATTNGLYESNREANVTEENMELKDLTLEMLQKRPDLIEGILATAKERERISTLEAEVAKLEAQKKELQDLAAAAEAKEATAIRDAQIDRLVLEAKIPDTIKYEEKDGKKVIRPNILSLLHKCESLEERQNLIADLEALNKTDPSNKKSAVVPVVSQEQIINFDAKFDIGEAVARLDQAMRF